MAIYNVTLSRIGVATVESESEEEAARFVELGYASVDWFGQEITYVEEEDEAEDLTT